MSGAVGDDRALSERYAIERELGRGGMGVVFLARDLRHDRQVAIKFLPADLAHAVGVERFTREIRTLARLSHPHILPLHDSGEAAGELYYVMPHVEGESLRQRLARDGAMRVPEALRVASQVADALAYAHARGVVHRDMKPENILLDPRGHAYVADFGIARVLRSSTSDPARLTSTAVRIGSPRYMSPEQIAGEAELDGRSDVYSLGCVLFEMLAGEPPFADADAQRVMRRHLVDPPPSLRERRADVGPGLDGVVGAMLAKAPEDRFASADSLAAALEDEIVVSTGDRTAPRLPDRRRRRLRHVALGGGVIVLAAAGALWALGSATPPATSPPATVATDARTSIAVLPFDDLSLDEDLSALARGLTNDLIAELQRVDALDVVSYAGVAPFRAGAVSVDSVARALRVGTLVTGEITSSGGRLRANVDIVDAATGRVIAPLQVERAWDDLLVLRDSLIADVAYALRQALGREIRLDAGRGRASSPEAWSLKQRAAQIMEDVGVLADAGDARRADRLTHEADSLLVLARALDPDWLDPVLDRAWIALRRASLGVEEQPAATAEFARGLALVDSILARAPRNGRALEARAALRLKRYLTSRVVDSAEVAAIRHDLETAVRADPDLTRAWTDLAMVLQLNGDQAAAALALESAYAADAYLENFLTILSRLFFLNYSMEQDERADHWCRELARRSTQAAQATMCRLMLLAAGPASRREVDLARRLRGQALAADGAGTAADMREPFDLEVAVVFARARQADSALAIIRRVRATSTDSAAVDLKEAEVLAALGRKDDAVAVLERLVAERPSYRAHLQLRRLRDLRDHPGYRRLTAARGDAASH